MAMSKQQMLSILQTMDEQNLAEALSAVGVECDYGDMDLGDPSVAEGLEPWNAREVAVGDPQKPEFFNKSVITKQQPQGPMAVTRPSYMGEEESSGEMADYLAHDPG